MGAPCYVCTCRPRRHALRRFHMVDSELTGPVTPPLPIGRANKGPLPFITPLVAIAAEVRRRGAVYLAVTCFCLIHEVHLEVAVQAIRASTVIPARGACHFEVLSLFLSLRYSFAIRATCACATSESFLDASAGACGFIQLYESF
jgi:hypothetical protein